MDARHPLIVFDLDGTLIDSAIGIAEAVNRTLEALGQSRAQEALIRSWIGDGVRALLRRVLDHAGIAPMQDAAFERTLALLMRHYEQSLPLQAQPYPGAGEALHGLHGAGVRLALCTNKPERFIAPLLDALGWRPLFDAVVGGDTLAEHKPSPLPLLHLADRFDVDPAKALMVGDSRIDAEAAHAAGMPLVLVDYGYPLGFDLQHAGALQVTGDLRWLLAPPSP